MGHGNGPVRGSILRRNMSWCSDWRYIPGRWQLLEAVVKQSDDEVARDWKGKPVGGAREDVNEMLAKRKPPILR
jgi:hypothetical protein